MSGAIFSYQEGNIVFQRENDFTDSLFLIHVCLYEL